MLEDKFLTKIMSDDRNPCRDMLKLVSKICAVGMFCFSFQAEQPYLLLGGVQILPGAADGALPLLPQGLHVGLQLPELSCTTQSQGKGHTQTRPPHVCLTRVLTLQVLDLFGRLLGQLGVTPPLILQQSCRRRVATLRH